MWIRRIAIGAILTILTTMSWATPPAQAGGRGDPVHGDFNNDGVTDIAFLGVVAPNMCSVIVTYGREPGVYLPPVAFTYLNPIEDEPDACPDIGVGFDWDDTPGDELWVGWTDDPPSSLPYNRLILDDPDFRPVARVTSPITPVFLGSADFTGDGRRTGYSYGLGGFATWVTDGDVGGPGPTQWCSADTPAVRLKDFNHNGAQDVLIAYTRGCVDSANGVVVVLNDGTVRQLQIDPERAQTWRAEVVYANGDRFPDVRTRAASGDIDYFIGTGTGDFIASPRAMTDAVYPTNSQKILINVLANDYATSQATVSIVTPPSHGTVQVLPDRRIAYTPSGGPVLADRFVYELTEEGRKSRAPVYVRPRI